MADWAAALAQGVGAAAASGAQSIGDDIKNQQQLQQQQQLEQQAADIKFDLSQRMNAADQLMKNAALQRYAAVVKDKMGEQVPAAAPTVQATGLTAASFPSVGLNPDGSLPLTAPAAAGAGDDDDDESDSAPAGASAAPGAIGFSGDMNHINTLLQEAKRRLVDPRRTPEQKADDQGIINQISEQIASQQTANKASVGDKTRARTLEEAVDAANEFALQNDPEAYVAGTTAYNNANKDDLAEKRLEQQGKLAREAGERQMTLEQMREAARSADIMAKIDGSMGGAGSKMPANVATIDYLMKNGMPFEKARDAVLGTGEGAYKDPVGMAASMASQLIANGAVRLDKSDPPGTDIAGKAMTMAMKQIRAAQVLRGPGMLDQGTGGVPNPLAPPGTIDPNNKDPLGLFGKH